MNTIAQYFELEAIEESEPKVMVIKLKNPRWDGWEIYRSWEDVKETIGHLLEETWDEEASYTGTDLAEYPLWDEYKIEMDHMTESEFHALQPLDY